MVHYLESNEPAALVFSNLAQTLTLLMFGYDFVERVEGYKC